MSEPREWIIRLDHGGPVIQGESTGDVRVIEYSAYEFMRSVADGCSQREVEVHDKLNTAIRERDEWRAAYMITCSHLDVANKERDDLKKKLEHEAYLCGTARTALDEARAERNTFEHELLEEQGRSARLVEALQYYAANGQDNQVAKDAIAPTGESSDAT